jgi:hypothetical protein
MSLAPLVILSPRRHLRVAILQPPPAPTQIPDRLHERSTAQTKGPRTHSAAETTKTRSQIPAIHATLKQARYTQ